MLSRVINHPDHASCYLFWDNQYVKLLQMQLQQSDGNSYSKRKKGQTIFSGYQLIGESYIVLIATLGMFY